MTLREIFGELREFLIFAEEGSELDEQALKDTFEALSYPLEQKLDGYWEVSASLERDAKALKEEAARLTEKAKALENNAKRVKDTAAYYVSMMPGKKVKSQLHNFGWKANGGKLALDYNEADVPKKYMTMKPVVNTDMIREALDAGKKLKWASYKERGEHFEWR